MKARVEVVRKLEIYQPTHTATEGADLHELKLNGETFCYAKCPSENLRGDVFYHFPMVIDADGSPWVEGNRYLLSRLDGFSLANHRTLDSVARDLVHFRRWLKDEDVDFLQFPPRQHARPTYRYCAHLHDELRDAKIGPGTARRKMSSVQGFYRWLQRDGVAFDYPLWQENDAYILFKDRHGFNRSKGVVSTDLTRSIKNPRSSSDYGEFIEDGGKLRPLLQEEQTALVQSLKRVGNTEMFLSFMLGLTTGARLQTIFTLRRGDFKYRLPENAGEHKLKVGAGTLVNTKGGKRQVIFVPAWLYRRLQLYLRSERCDVRVRRSPHRYDEETQYAFLTRTGTPYYMAFGDPFAYLYQSPPRGNAVTQFMRQQLKPDLKKYGESFAFRFHDLRATFGMRLLEHKLNVDGLARTGGSGQPEFFSALMYIKERMGHSRLSTTEAYLNYRERYPFILHVQSEYEHYLEQLTSSFGTNVDVD